MNPGASHGRRARVRLFGAVLLFGLLFLTFAACGISLGADEKGTEIFKDLTIEGDFSAGSRLTLTLEYAQPYSVDVGVECVLLASNPVSTATPKFTGTATSTPDRDATPTSVPIPRAEPTPKNKVLDILREQLPANPQEVPPAEATPVLGVIVEEFPAPERPGRYVVRCLTPDDDNNAISETIRIASAAAPTP